MFKTISIQTSTYWVCNLISLQRKFAKRILSQRISNFIFELILSHARKSHFIKLNTGVLSQKRQSTNRMSWTSLFQICVLYAQALNRPLYLFHQFHQLSALSPGFKSEGRCETSLYSKNPLRRRASSNFEMVLAGWLRFFGVGGL